MSASLSRHTAFSARPRPFSSRCTTRRTVDALGQRDRAAHGAVGARVVGDGDPRRIRHALARRWASRRRTASTMSSCSL